MQVLYKIVGVVGWVTLFDQAQGAVVVMPDYKGSVKYMDYKAPGFGAASISITNQSNALVTLPWKFSIVYATLAAATAASRTMQLLAASQLHLQVIQDGEKQFYPNGTAASYSWEQTGAKVMHNFVFEMQLVTTIAPTT